MAVPRMAHGRSHGAAVGRMAATLRAAAAAFTPRARPAPAALAGQARMA